jgi:hypothetical protein
VTVRARADGQYGGTTAGPTRTEQPRGSTGHLRTEAPWRSTAVQHQRATHSMTQLASRLAPAIRTAGLTAPEAVGSQHPHLGGSLRETLPGPRGVRALVV